MLNESSGEGGNEYSPQHQGEPYWALAYTASVFSLPPGTGSSVNLGAQQSGAEVTLLGSTKDGYTYVSVGGTTGYVSTGAIKKMYRGE